MKIVADRDRCEGHGFCEEIAPDLFKLDEDGKVTTVQSHLEPEQLADAQAAAATCPATALRIDPD